MSKMTRLASLALAVLIAVAASLMPHAARSQTQPAPPAAAPSAPAPSAAPATPPVAATVPAQTTVGKELVDNPYGLEALWKGGDYVSKTTIAILVIMSMGSWYIIITKVYEQYRMGRQARAAQKKFWNAPTVRQGVENLKKGSPYRYIAETGLEATTTHTGLLGNVDMNEWISMSLQRAIDNLVEA